MEKVKYIAESDIAKKYLSVCVNGNLHDGNCSVCAKCTVTMAAFDAIGKLDGFENVFDVPRYRKNINYYDSYMLMKSRAKERWCLDIYKNAKENGKVYSPIAYIEAFIKWAKRGFSANNKNRA